MMANLLNIFKLKKKKPARLSYEDYIINRAFEGTTTKITSVHNIEIIKTLPLREGIYEEITALLQEGIGLLKNLPTDENLLEDLTIITFTNQTGDNFAGIIYDGYDAFEEPVVVDVIRLPG